MATNDPCGLRVLYEIRQLVEPVPGKLMLPELVEAIRRIIAERDAANRQLGEQFLQLLRTADTIATMQKELREYAATVAMLQLFRAEADAYRPIMESIRVNNVSAGGDYLSLKATVSEALWYEARDAHHASITAGNYSTAAACEEAEGGKSARETEGGE